MLPNSLLSGNIAPSSSSSSPGRTSASSSFPASTPPFVSAPPYASTPGAAPGATAIAAAAVAASLRTSTAVAEHQVAEQRQALAQAIQQLSAGGGQNGDVRDVRELTSLAMSAIEAMGGGMGLGMGGGVGGSMGAGEYIGGREMSMEEMVHILQTGGAVVGQPSRRERDGAPMAEGGMRGQRGKMVNGAVNGSFVGSQRYGVYAG